jgi:hypothetical protein
MLRRLLLGSMAIVAVTAVIVLTSASAAAGHHRSRPDRAGSLQRLALIADARLGRVVGLPVPGMILPGPFHAQSCEVVAGSATCAVRPCARLAATATRRAGARLCAGRARPAHVVPTVLPVGQTVSAP